MKKVLAAALAFTALLVLGACGTSGTSETVTSAGIADLDLPGVADTTATKENEKEANEEGTSDIDGLDQPTNPTDEESDNVSTPWKQGDKYPEITITIGDLGKKFKGGVIKAELYPGKAPNTVHNFISLINSGYFTGRVFHRAVPGFMIQGGSVNGDGMSIGFPYAIQGEFAQAGFPQNDIKHTRGVLSMARTNYPHSGSTQFFIMHDDSIFLDGQYAAFGKVTSGLEVVDRIADLPTQSETLVDKPVISSITVDTFGISYPAPVTVPVQ